MKPIEKKCFRLVQEIVCERDGVCQRCGKMPISGHHFFGRRNHSTCFDPQGMLGLCVECHAWAHSYPEMARELLRSLVGDECYTWLEALSRTVCRLKEGDFRLIAERLRKQLEGMKG